MTKHLTLNLYPNRTMPITLTLILDTGWLEALSDEEVRVRIRVTGNRFR